ncbi:glutathione S-transferase family protein [Marinobacterium arenosum]|uniref:glutathione S-transferase family protein n=1 Tax=Marinobacterium arenosum TaxID=2862496 RepID=UPI001C943C50|nr:glutathione S-transferase family protein [Marinobacterium arenosum]MBY4676199.1 glutathione S-transferase family protein [Marinobacterium arenosum]
MLIDGRWQENWQPVQGTDEKGGFVRQSSSFRHWITPDGNPGPDGEPALKAEPGRFHLYVAYICPWACRTLVARALKGLEEVISVSLVEPELTEQGWQFGHYSDPHGGARYMHQKYSLSDSHYTGRATVPVLWDKQQQRIVNNESADILRILNSGFGELANELDLYPTEHRSEIDQLNSRIYQQLNNGVYRAGFATTQLAYREAVDEVFAELDRLEQRLSGRDYLMGDRLTESDIRLFVTLVRFDAAYYGLFKCNYRPLSSYPQLTRYLNRLIARPAFASAVNLDHIKRGYYSIRALNPTGIVPAGPAELPFSEFLEG